MGWEELEEMLKREEIYVQLQLIHIVVQQKLTHFETINPPTKKKKKKTYGKKKNKSRIPNPVLFPFKHNLSDRQTLP